MNNRDDKPVTTLIVGIGGYGFYYLKTLLHEIPPEKAQLVGVVDPAATDSGLYPVVRGLGVPVFSHLEDFYDRGNTAELAVIASPIHYHVPQSITALKHGSHVLCEKPIGTTVQDADELLQVCNTSDTWVMIGYQWSYSRAIQSLKKDVRAGLFGNPIRLKTLCCWTRDDAYYQRNDWAGKIKDEKGRWILDSPANNALAHFLHNMFYILGEDVHLSAQPTEVITECYRANPIENYDTVACRVHTDAGAELLFYGSHATSSDKDPMFTFEFEDAVISFGDKGDEIIATDRQGRTKHYGSPDDDHQFLKLFEAIHAVRHPQPVICGPEAARSQTLCINGIQESAAEIATFPVTIRKRDETAGRWWVAKLEEALLSCYAKGVLPGDLHFDWARSGEPVDLKNYRYYPGGDLPRK
jgi:predicted dehydrogenase